MLSKAIQVLVGPQRDVTSADVDALCELGIVLRDEEGALRGFSRIFEDHLRLVERSIDIWPLWRETEHVLRAVLERHIYDTFGEDWPHALGHARPKLKGVIEQCRKRRDQERRSIGARSPELSLLAYSYPTDLYQLMCADWPRLGEPLLGKDKHGWAVKFTVLSRVRTPLAHNREEAVDDGGRKQAEGICREILNRYRESEHALP